MATISGIVTKGSSSTPGAAKVLLFNEAGDTIVASTTSDASTGAYSFTGLAGGVYRVVVLGGNVYRSRAYGPCTVVETDPNFSSVISLLHFDGNFTDQKGKVWTPQGGAAIDAAKSRFGSGSLYLPGTASDYVGTPKHTDFDLVSNAFTFETHAFFDPAQPTNQSSILTQYTDVTGGNSFGFAVGGANTTSRNRMKFFGYINASYFEVQDTSGAAIPLNQWLHLAWTRSASTVYFFVNGAARGSAAVSGAISTANSEIRFGRAGNFPNPFKGWLDDPRFTKGVARYTAAFTPPNSPFPNS